MDAKNTTRIRHTRTKAIHTNGACILIVIVLDGAHVSRMLLHTHAFEWALLTLKNTMIMLTMIRVNEDDMLMIMKLLLQLKFV
ncbi:hypothetical protein HZH66_000064 [Vespula vulgaris]|uniref:Uncharacterized protein n=1 Tax=Vespula vulgaris TaxID=7454 RepID=A0A834NKU6_VESVU|nr:hypothetical protein HZH66_000064 [Vespula vulgaris]